MVGEKFDRKKFDEEWSTYFDDKFDLRQAERNRQERREEIEKEKEKTNLVEAVFEKIATDPKVKQGVSECLAVLAAAGVLVGVALWNKGESHREQPDAHNQYEYNIDYDSEIMTAGEQMRSQDFQRWQMEKEERGEQE